MKTRALFFALASLAAALPALARSNFIWTYDKLKADADLVVIATPVAVQDLDEQTTLPGIEVVGPDNKPAPVPALGVETNFIIQTTLKGTTVINRIVLHHLRLANPPTTAEANAPQLVKFDPTKGVRYLMFLKKDADGHYTSVTGQTDPAIAIIPLGTYP